MAGDGEFEWEFPEKLEFLFQPKRYKCAYGGRGSGKSWGFARALLIQGAIEPLRILCVREVQRSIRDSVHRLLSDQIVALNLQHVYQVLDSEIRGTNGTLFLFSGLSTQTADSIKSFEGVDRVWCEEAQTITKSSWDILIPTIRKNLSEIWVTFNPELDSDETFVRFVSSQSPDCHTVKLNYSDNPWFPDVLEKEREKSKISNPVDYPVIWEGNCRPAVSGAIYASEVAQAMNNNNICNVPYDPMLKVHVVIDLGWNDAMAIALVQSCASELRVIEYIEDSHKTLDFYSAMLREKRLNFGTMFLPHDGRHRDFKTGRSAEDIMRALGWDVRITPNIGIEDGIRLTRMMFRRIYFDKNKTARLLECVKRYKRSFDKLTNQPGAPCHDEFSHGADCLRYIVINADSMTNESWESSYDEDNYNVGRSAIGGY